MISSVSDHEWFVPTMSRRRPVEATLGRDGTMTADSVDSMACASCVVAFVSVVEKLGRHAGKRLRSALVFLGVVGREARIRVLLIEMPVNMGCLLHVEKWSGRSDRRNKARLPQLTSVTCRHVQRPAQEGKGSNPNYPFTDHTHFFENGSARHVFLMSQSMSNWRDRERASIH